MISKVITGHSFRGSLLYILQENKHAEVLRVEGVRSHHKSLMIADFIRQHQLRPEKKQACFHSILSFYPGEKPADKMIVGIAEQYLKGLNISETQYAIIKHTDKRHLHVHIIANMVNNQGKSIGDNWIGLKGKKLSQQLTIEHKLVKALSKKLELTHIQNLRSPGQHQYKMYEAIKKNLPGCRSMEELQLRLAKEKIEMMYKYKGRTGEVQGVSFKFGEYKFKGSKIDRQFSFSNLEKTIALQQKPELQMVQHQQRSITVELAKHQNKELVNPFQFSAPPGNVPEPIDTELLRQAKKKKLKL